MNQYYFHNILIDVAHQLIKEEIPFDEEFKFYRDNKIFIIFIKDIEKAQEVEDVDTLINYLSIQYVKDGEVINFGA